MKAIAQMMSELTQELAANRRENEANRRELARLSNTVSELSTTVKNLNSRLDRMEARDTVDDTKEEAVKEETKAAKNVDDVPSEESISQYLTRNNIPTKNDYAKTEKSKLDRMLEAQLSFNDDSITTVTTKTEVTTSVTTSRIVTERSRFEGLKDRYKSEIESCTNPSELSEKTTSILTEVEDLMDKFKNGEEAALLSSAYDEALGAYKRKIDHFKALKENGTVKTSVTKVTYNDETKQPSREQETALGGIQSPSVGNLSTDSEKVPQNANVTEFYDLVVKPFYEGII